ncbi:MAG TPA: Rrf2 family transcriptional regulator [Acidobacteriaceae bacterium]|nr:Rrf2 family transcriptional regulator [Acidobacteriaceae bacterium]
MALNARFVTGIQALVLLAAEPEKRHRSEDIAHKLGTNPVVVRRIFVELQKAGLIQSHKGPSGGSKLAMTAKEITLREVHRALHPQGVLQAPKSSGIPGLAAALKGVLNDASRALEKELTETTLSQLAKKAQKRSAKR